MENRTITFAGGKSYALDDHGFLDPPDQWDEDFAEGMARKLGIVGGLTAEHWSFLRYLRKKFLEEKSVPVVVLACSENRIRLGQMRRLFPTGYHRGACKIAGINYKFMYDHNIWLTYESYPVLKAEHELTPLGFLKDFGKWNERFAETLAGDWNLAAGLTPRHWKVIRYLRDSYERTNNIPTIYETCKAHGLELDEFRRMFPDGYRRGACRAAGLPFLA
ncbi:MAG: TusE/DsrC/DsvC family sulfur relay protein [Planctomycetota bacterium]|jgi:tRNA 2-thiouridine synthesizing protein E